MKWILILLLTLSCGKSAINGKDGASGSDGMNGLNGAEGQRGLNYYSYMVDARVQKVEGDTSMEVFEVHESEIYQFPKSFDVTVNDMYPECIHRNFFIKLETDSEVYRFEFEPSSERYKYQYKSGPLNKVVDSSKVKVYYESVPEMDCGSVIYRVAADVRFQIRVIKELEVE